MRFRPVDLAGVFVTISPATGGVMGRSSPRSPSPSTGAEACGWGAHGTERGLAAGELGLGNPGCPAAGGGLLQHPEFEQGRPPRLPCAHVLSQPPSRDHIICRQRATVIGDGDGDQQKGGGELVAPGRRQRGDRLEGPAQMICEER